MEKHNSIVLIILYILVITVSVLAIYLGITLSNSKKEVDELSNQLTSKGNNITTDKNEVVSNNENNNTNNNVTENNNTNTLEKEFSNAVLDLEKCLNATEDRGYKIKSVALENNSSFCEYSSTKAIVKMNQGKENTVTNIDKKIVDVVFTGYGQDISHTVLLFLLEDGSVNYLTYADMYRDNNFASKKLIDVKNVVRIVEGESYSKSIGIGQMSPFLVNNKGEFYDVSALIK